MLKSIATSLLLVCLIFGCKTSDSTPEQTATSVREQNMDTREVSTTTSANNNTGELDREAQHQFDAFVKQGDSNYAEGKYREALNFYKKAQNLAPNQIGNDKLIACIKAMQEPSTRNK